MLSSTTAAWTFQALAFADRPRLFVVAAPGFDNSDLNETTVPHRDELETRGVGRRRGLLVASRLRSIERVRLRLEKRGGKQARRRHMREMRGSSFPFARATSLAATTAAHSCHVRTQSGKFQDAKTIANVTGGGYCEDWYEDGL